MEMGADARERAQRGSREMKNEKYRRSKRGRKVNKGIE